MATYIIGAAVFGAMALVGVSLYRERKRNKEAGGCGGSCCGCSQSGCHDRQ